MRIGGDGISTFPKWKDSGKTTARSDNIFDGLDVGSSSEHEAKDPMLELIEDALKTAKPKDGLAKRLHIHLSEEKCLGVCH